MRYLYKQIRNIYIINCKTSIVDKQTFIRNSMRNIKENQTNKLEFMKKFQISFYYWLNMPQYEIIGKKNTTN